MTLFIALLIIEGQDMDFIWNAFAISFWMMHLAYHTKVDKV